jgi:pimeloyl-ACP methyl ester carboxylesterase
LIIIPKVKVNDIEIFYEEHGEGQPVIMIPGWSGSTKSYPAFTQIFARYFRFIVFDNRGAGQSSKPDIEYTTRMMADDAAGFMDSIGLERANIFGASMSGMIAQELAINHKEKVRKLVLACTSCGGPNSVPISMAVRETTDRYIDAPLEMTPRERENLLLDIFYTQELLEERREQVLEDRLSIKKLAPPPPSYALRRQNEAIYQHDAYDRLSEIEANTLIVHGKKDAIFPYENASILAKRMPNAEIKLYEKTGHSLVEEGEQILKDIIGFLMKQ